MLTPNTILQNRYQIIRQLGQGGMGTVYEAKALRLNATVALKETHFTDEHLRKQFEREAQLLANLRHSALPRVIDHFDEGDGLFLVMDFIKGEDLWEMLQRNGVVFPVNEVLEWADQLLDALDYLHSQEPHVIHRDIKPQNLKLTARNQIILLDFGLAKGFAGQVSRVTTSGSIFGYTPNYAPLEQIQGTGTDPRSDLYSLAATLYHLMTGIVPPDALTRVTSISDGQPDPLQSAHIVNGQVQPQVADVLNKALAIGRSQRFPTAAEMRQALHEARQLQSIMNVHKVPQKPNPALASSVVALPVKPLSTPSSNPKSSITVSPLPALSAYSKQQSYLRPLIIGGIALIFVGITITIILNYNSGTANTNSSSFNSNAGNTNLSNIPDTSSNISLSKSVNQNLTPPINNGNSSSSNVNLNRSDSNQTVMNTSSLPVEPTMRADPTLFPPDQNSSSSSEAKDNQSVDYNKIFLSREVDQKARILSRPEPQYTEEARRNQVTGTIVLRVVLASNGTVTNITTIKGLPDGLTEKAMAAARQIKFVPAMKDGRQVSQYVQLEYNLNLY